MKEAMGELNSTVITVISVAAFAVFFFSYLWPIINNSIELDTNCAKAVCDACPSNNCQSVQCYVDGDVTRPLTCAYKG